MKRMGEDEYREECRKWDEFIELRENFYSTRQKIYSDNRLNEEVKDLANSIVEIQYGWNEFNPTQFGPYTKIYSKDDLLDRNFKLPGINKSFLDLPEDSVDIELPQMFGKYIVREDVVEEYTNQVVIGFGYDATDYYIICSSDNFGGEISINMNLPHRYEDREE